MRRACCALAAIFAVTVASPSYAAQDFCGQIQSLPDAWLILNKSSKLYFSADTSGPTDQKDVYGYLNKHHSDSDHRCYCITGSVISQSRGTGVARVFTKVTGLKTCGGQILR
jgi:hypothetical protein